MRRPRLLYLVTEDWYFVSHRLPMARAAQAAGYDVHVATRVERHGDAIVAEGFTVHQIDLHRGSLNPLHLAASVRAARALYRRLGPDLIHHIALQPSIVGSLAARGFEAPLINSIFGLGSVFSAHTLAMRTARLVVRRLLPNLFNRAQSVVLVVNPDHRDQLIRFGVTADHIAVIPGSGVDIEKFTPLPEPPEPVTLGYAGRMLEDKGVRTLVEAQRRLLDAGHDIRLLLAGTPDPANPNTISERDLAAWSQRRGVRWLGQVGDIRDVWRDVHIAVLMSRSEGLPLSLLEAAACGRPLIASDVPGCREIARDGINALLVPPDDPAALSAAIAELAGDAARRRDFGAAGRKLVETTYGTAQVAAAIVAIYRRLAPLPSAHGGS
jgi:glycosyltransferase involved in cell wall biosynthesis